MQFRYYQIDAIEAIYRYFREYTGNPVIAMPTGTGKSVVIGGFVRNVFEQWPNQRVMMVTHVKELIAQNFGKLLQLWPTAPAGIYSAGLGRKDNAPITFAGIDSVWRTPELFGRVDIVLIDECHLVAPNDNTKYQKFLSALRAVNPHVKVIGFSATCYRLGQGRLTEDGGLFTHVAYDITQRESFNKLISEGYISPLVPKKTNTELDVSGVHSVGGEFNLHELQDAVNREVITYYALSELVQRAKESSRKSWLIFTTGIDHTENVARMLVDKFGVSAKPVHSKIPNSQNDISLRTFRAGELTCLVNNNVLTTGFDHPNIDLIGVLRPTKSPVLWVQMLGRGTRPAPGKQNCLVLDFAGNTKKLGPVNDPVLPNPKGKKKGDQPGQAPVRLCEACLTWNHASARICETCGEEFTTAVRFNKTADDRELIAGDLTMTLPIVETFAVNRVVYTRHTKHDRPDSLKISYYCGLRTFQEWVCFEHQDFALHRAHEWWRARSVMEPPGTVTLALAHVNELQVPTHIKVWTNTTHKQIMDHAFNGAFLNDKH